MGLPNTVFGKGPFETGGGGAPPAADIPPVLTLISPPPMVNMGEQVDYQSFIALEEFLLDVKAIDFDGSNEYLQIASAAGFNFQYNSKFSISVWLSTTDVNYQIMLGKMAALPDPYRGWQLALDSGRARMILENDAASNRLDVRTTYDLQPFLYNGLFHHVMATYDGSTDASGVTIYVNGVPAPTEIMYDTLDTDDCTTAIDLNIARTDYGFYYDGYLAHISIWSDELTSSEATTIYNGGRPGDLALTAPAIAGKLVTWWQTGDGDDGAGTDDSTGLPAGRIYDMSGNGHTLLPVNTEAGDIVDV